MAVYSRWPDEINEYLCKLLATLQKEGEIGVYMPTILHIYAKEITERIVEGMIEWITMTRVPIEHNGKKGFIILVEYPASVLNYILLGLLEDD